MDTSTVQRILVRNVGVGSQNDIEFPLDQIEKFAILRSLPAFVLDR